MPNSNEDHMIFENFIFDEDEDLEEDKMSKGSYFITTFLFPILTDHNDIVSWISSIDVRLVGIGGEFE
jgi:hypothetical protein